MLQPEVKPDQKRILPIWMVFLSFELVDHQDYIIFENGE